MVFKLFDTTIPHEAKDFKDFGPLNTIIERDNMSPDAVRQAYHDLLLGVLDDSQKLDIHWQLQYLFEEVKIPVNRVLYFLDAKFGSLTDAIKQTIAQSKLVRTGIWQDLPLFTNMSIIGRIESRIKNLKAESEKALVVLEFPSDQTPEQRLEAFRNYIRLLEQNISEGDVISTQGFIIPKPNNE